MLEVGSSGWNVPSITTFACTATGFKIAVLAVAPKAGNIRYLRASVSAVSAPDAFTATLEGITAAFVPDGTPLATGVSWTPVTGVTRVDLGAIAVTQGQRIAGAFTYGTTGSATFNRSGGSISRSIPWGATASGAGYSVVNAGRICIALEYDDGTVIDGCNNLVSLATNVINNSERANVWTPSFNCSALGMRFISATAASQNLQAALYAGTSTTPLTSLTLGTLPGGIMTDVLFPAAVALSAGTAYRFSVRETGGVNTNIITQTYASAADLALFMGAAFSSDTRTNGAWAGATTTAANSIWPVIDNTATLPAVTNVKSGVDRGDGQLGTLVTGGGSTKLGNSI